MGSEPAYAHSATPSGHCDPLRSHLSDVAERAAEYASAFDGADEARVAGLLHDLGKYGALFQRRLLGLEQGIDHWSPGAWVAVTRYKQHGIAPALAVQGHHLGLRQAAADALRALDPTRLAQAHPDVLRLAEADTDALVQRLGADGVRLPDALERSVYSGLGGPPVAAMLDVRMLFSALVDADYIETEAHFAASTPESKCYRQAGPALEPQEALQALLAYLRCLAECSDASRDMLELRQQLLDACLASAEQDQGLFTVTAPTGAGKTLALLAFALAHAAKHDLRRVVTVLPYLTIIEQTASVYEQALRGAMPADAASLYILEDHSLAPAWAADADPDMNAARLLAENWDAPIVVTTSVQFLESLFANRPGPCRKLHRLARSVIILDEVQTLPKPLAVPTLAALSRLAERYGSTVVLATATQPAFSHLDCSVRPFCSAGWRPREIVPDPTAMARNARRTSFEWSLEEPVSWETLSDRMMELPQALCIVNLRRHAFELVQTLRCRDATGLFHLSTSMCPAHRHAVLNAVRQRLRGDEPCRLVATQCVEAGVDIDFPVVFRALGPLDAIAQAAGRCNREGRADGVVQVFLPDDQTRLYPDGAYQQAAAVTSVVLARRGTAELDITDPQVFHEYFCELYDVAGTGQPPRELAEALQTQDFQKVARCFRVIPDATVNVVVPYKPDVFEELREEVLATGLTRRWVQRARPHAIGLFRPQQNDAVTAYLDPVPVGMRGERANDWFLYLCATHYDPVTGLVPPGPTGCFIA